MDILKIRACLIFWACLVLSACADNAATDEIFDPDNQRPEANAGADQLANEGVEIFLDGSASSDPEGSELSYSWKQIDGAAVELTDSNKAVASFIADVSSDTNLSFRLAVLDSAGLEGLDEITISINNAPTAVIEGATSANEGATVVLSGEQSSDTDGDSIASYSWSQTAGTSATLTESNQSTLTFTAPVISADEDLSFELVVTDQSGASGRASAVVSVVEDSLVPAIESVNLASGTYGIGGALVITLVAADAETGLTLKPGSTFNGQELSDFAALEDQPGSYTATYNVAAADASVADGEVASANLVLVDLAGNESAAIVEILLDGVSIDTAPPGIADIVVAVGNHGIGADVAITFIAIDSETDLSLKSGSTFNGQELTAFAPLADQPGSYTATYSVISGDPDVAASAELNTSIALVDIAGNESNATTSLSLGSDTSIDANAPVIDSISVPQGAYGIASTVAVTIVAAGAESGLSLSATANKFNSRALSAFADAGSGTYSATYTVSEGDADVAQSSSADSNISLVDAHGNASSPITSVELTSSSIDANKPQIASVSIADGVYGIDSDLVILITAANSETGLQFSDPAFNNKNLSDFSDLQDGSYALTYSVAAGDTDRADGAPVPANIVLLDSAGNASQGIAEVNLSGESIDATAPVISNISVAAGSYGIDDSATITITAANSEADLALQSGSTFNGQGLTAFAPLADQPGSYTALYTVASGNPDAAASASVSTSIVLLDSAGNASAENTSIQLDSSTSIDANAPVIDSIGVASGAYGIGDVIRVSIFAADAETDLNLSATSNTFNSQTLSEFISIGSGTYSAIYTVNEGDSDIAEGLSADTNISLVDAYGNASPPITSVELTSSSIDANKPSVESISINDGIYGVGSEMVIFITAANSDTGLQALDPTFNDKNLSNFSDLQNGLYALTYLVEEGDSDQADGATVEANLSFVDAVGNVGASTTEVNLSGASIDANSPAISAISVAAGNHGIGANVAITISAASGDTGLALQSGSSFNGGELSALQPVAGQDGNYTTTYSVSSDHEHIDAEANVATSITLIDLAANTSATTTSVPLDASTSIDTNAPVISSISVAEGAHGIGDNVTITITALDDHNGLTLLDSSNFNGGGLAALTFTGEQSGTFTYTTTYTVTAGQTDVAAENNVTSSITLSDTAGNHSATTTSVPLGADTSIDANAPTITAISVDAGKHGIDDSVAITISADDSDANLALVTGSSFNGGSLSDLVAVADQDGTYTTTYTVAAGQSDIAADNNVTSSIALVDTAGNVGTATTSVPLGADTSIDANAPTITAISVEAGNHGIGDSVAITISAEDSDTNLALTMDSSFNGGSLSDLVAVADQDGNYTTTYTVTAGQSDVAAENNVTSSITLSDTAGNPSATTTSVQLDASTSIDANAPTAKAGNNQAVNEGGTVELNASNSSDAHAGSIVAYSWQQTGDTSTYQATLSAANTSVASFTPEGLSADATLTFLLTVTDGGNNNDTDTVEVHVNNAPTANAGADQEVNEDDSVELNATASSDTDGGTISYAWSQTEGPSVSIDGNTTAEATFTAPQVTQDTNLTFNLTVTDDDGASNTDSVIITINNTPTADAGTDQEVNESVALTLSGSGTDTDDDTLAYQWQLSGISGDTAASIALEGNTTTQPTFTTPQVTQDTALTFQLTVTDSNDASATDSVIITVNNAPTANAGADQGFNEDDQVTLDGSTSQDTDGGTISFLWQLSSISGDTSASITLDDNTSATPTFTAPSVEQDTTLAFLLTVTDNDGASHTDSVVININNAPTANAGDYAEYNESSTDTNITVTLDATASSDTDSGTLAYQWQLASTSGDTTASITLENNNIATPTFTAPQVTQDTNLTFNLTVTDNDDANDTDSVVIAIHNLPVIQSVYLPDAAYGIDATATIYIQADSSETGLNLKQEDGALHGSFNGEPLTNFTDIGNGLYSATYTVQADDPSVADGSAVETNITLVDAQGNASLTETSVTLDGEYIDTAPPEISPVITIPSGAYGIGSNLTLYIQAQDSETDLVIKEGAEFNGSTLSNTREIDNGTYQAVHTVEADDTDWQDGSEVPVSIILTDPAGNDSTELTFVTLDGVSIYAHYPTAEAGDQYKVGDDSYSFAKDVNENIDVALDGSGSEDAFASTENLDYSWELTAITNVSDSSNSRISINSIAIDKNTTTQPTFTTPEVSQDTNLTFQLTVTDAGGNSATDTATITVNNAPTADAGADQEVNENTNVALIGSGSSDTNDGSIKTYRWVEIDNDGEELSSPNVTLTGAETATATFTSPMDVSADTTLSFKLTVTDNDGASSSDVISVLVNNAPTAEAGDNQEVNENTTVTLSGSSSDTDDGSIETYSWIEIDGDGKELSSPNVTLTNAETATATFTSPMDVNADTNLTFQLTVTDDDGASSSDVISVLVNNAPTAEAGDNQEVNENTDVTLIGSGSDTDDGSIETYSWIEIDGDGEELSSPNVTLTNAETATATFTSPANVDADTTLSFKLTVTDDDGASSSDVISVLVNNAPTAEAGDNQEVNENTTVTLTGSGSDTDDGSIETYSWIEIDGDGKELSSPNVTLTGAATATATFTSPANVDADTTLSFKLTVTDDDGASSSDVISVLVNNAPTAEAGDNQEVNENTTVTLSGSSSDTDDGSIETYRWVEIDTDGEELSSPNVTLTNAETATATFTSPMDVNADTNLTFQLTVTDDDGASSSDVISVLVNNAPTAEAGDNQEVNENTDVTLIGSGSDTDDGSIETYSWIEIDGDGEELSSPNVTLTNAETATATFTSPANVDADTTLSFKLTVTDDDGASSSDVISVLVNNAPTAEAGDNQEVNENTTVTLTGSGSDTDDGSIETYSWIEIDGDGKELSSPNVTLTGAATATATFTSPANVDADTTLSFKLTVTDDDGASSSDVISVLVNNAPTAEAGDNQEVNENTTVTLSGSGSDTDDGSIETYRWVEIDTDGEELSSPNVTLTNAETATATFTSPMDVNADTNLTFQLTVTDDDGASSSDVISVLVNNAPTAEAGDNQEVNENTDVTLIGSGSDTDDGSIETYSWIEIDGDGEELSSPNVTLTNAETATATFTSPANVDADTTLSFKLTVTDDDGASSSDVISVLVNNAPTAEAGDNQEVNENTTVTLTGSGSDTDDGSIETYSWIEIDGDGKELSSPNVTLTGAATATATFTSPANVDADTTLSFKLTVTDDDGASSSDVISVLVNNAPTAEAGDNQEVNENTTVTLSGSGSDTDDGSIETYRWVEIDTDGEELSSPNVTLTNAETATATFTSPMDVNADTILTFQLTVTDDDGAIATDSVIITVNNAPTAVANASPSVVNENITVSLAAAGSGDVGVGSSIVSYSWEEINGSILSDNAIDISNPSSSSASFISPSVDADTAITLQLTVTDNDGASSTATTTVLVNNAPDVSISVDGTMIDNDGSLNIDEGDSVLLEGSSTDSDKLSYQWQQVNSDSTTSISSKQNYTFDSSELELTADASYTLRFTVTDEHDASSSQDITIYVTNTAPTASATATTEVNESTTGVALNGSASSGGVSSYSWAQLLNASDDYEVDIINSDQAKANFTAPTLSSPNPITLTFQLTVDDDDAKTDSNTSKVEITVRNLPTISSITIADETIDGIEAYGIGDEVTVDIQAGNNETALSLKGDGDNTNDGTFNGQKLTDFII